MREAYRAKVSVPPGLAFGPPPSRAVYKQVREATKPAPPPQRRPRKYKTPTSSVTFWIGKPMRGVIAEIAAAEKSNRSSIARRLLRLGLQEYYRLIEAEKARARGEAN